MNLEIPNSDVLARILREHDIPLHTWGVGSAKSLADLMKEISAWESSLCIVDGRLTRYVRVAFVDVFYVDPIIGARFKLKESHQVFADGRRRDRNLDTSVNEKLIANEDSMVGARRGVAEELGFPHPIYLEPGNVIVDTYESPSYPGLTAQFQKNFFSLAVGADLYKKEGYVEDDGKKKTFFVWTPVSTV